MKNVITILTLIFCISTASFSQPFRNLDKSPLDATYLPDNFAHDRKSGEKAIIKVYYSRPMKNGRKIFGSLISYGKVWRTGANEAVEFKAYQDITIDGKKLKAGTYSLFTIPGEKEWTVIINADLDYWGAYSYNQQHDVLRIKVPVNSLPEVVEAFSIQLADKGNNSAVMKLAWDKTMVEVPITYVR